MAKKFMLPVTWEVCGSAEVDAESIEEAVAYFNENSDHIKLPAHSEYVDGSFELSCSELEYLQAFQAQKPRPAKPLYIRILEAGIPKSDIDHHETDLYVRVTEQSKRVIENYIKEAHAEHMVKTFRSNIAPHDLWYDCPFCYLPMWEERLQGQN